jgi:acetoin utilization protein AcuB
MHKTTPLLQDFMTTSPHIIGRDQTLEAAHKIMRSNGIRHLPVLHGGHIVGILSQRDLALIETLTDVDPAKVAVDEAMSTSVFAAEPSAPLAQIAATMAEHKYGCCVAMTGAKVVGILTTVDICRALCALLEPKGD